MNNYEQKIRRVIGLTMALAGTSFMVTLILFAIYFAKLHYSKLFFVGWSAVATILAVIAQDRFNRFKALLVPNTFSTQEFNTILTKYKKHQALGSPILLVLIIMGIIIGALGSLID
ncbi:hypothetical protein [Xanthomonas campestris]|uniref:hypothetical protein n=2 Tax=Xanthomonas campestris TaxID=339 RepID=UPI0008A51688|nr:hypothetical protein [Xanthomonas campestris]MEB1152400.1 hypothetical protein [Xanthomonas campestris pv. campestris]MCC5098566.1 hypothetical protein [Xanthomonas campestris]MEA9584390.1 hypothetical protein [Xanthomonas campestris]MEA9594073.1 hypothetical protein [Xanthomonas campestris]MEA9625518.1 hypothetical protein [Xanthomonas campestris]